MVHPTYKHLEAKLRFGSFSVGQWAQIAGAGAFAVAFGAYVSPLPTGVTIFVSIVAAGLPIALSYGAMGLEFSVAQFARAAWRFWREPRRFLPGPGDTSTGYHVHAPVPAADIAARQAQTARGGEAEALWDF